MTCFSSSRWLAVLLCGFLAGVPGRAEETELREFVVKIDSKPAGAYRVTYTAKSDGTIAVASQADLRVKTAPLTTTTISYTGAEVWKGGRLLSLQGTRTEGGKRLTVTAAAEGKSLKVRVDNKPTDVRADVWLTTAWLLPDAVWRNGAVPLLEADRGRALGGQLQQVNTSKATVAGKMMEVAHYRLTTEVVHDLWYDAKERLVRREWDEGGKKAVMELIRLGR